MKIIVSGISTVLNEFYNEAQKVFTNQGDTVLYEAYKIEKTIMIVTYCFLFLMVCH